MLTIINFVLNPFDVLGIFSGLTQYFIQCTEIQWVKRDSILVQHKHSTGLILLWGTKVCFEPSFSNFFQISFLNVLHYL